ncbi:MAG: VPLPA-CTERM sorting domain-containing protein [Phycisphaerales bacterium JB040]
MKTAALIAVAGLASAAAAQSVTVNLTHDDADSNIAIGETVTWTLSISFTGFADGAAASGGNMRINGDNALGTSSDMTYTPVNGGNAESTTPESGDSNGAGIQFVSWTNSIFLESFGGGPAIKTNPFVVGTFDFTGNAEGTLNYSVVRGQATSAFVSIDLSAFATSNFTTADVSYNVQSLTIVPTPASAALLGLGGLVATRRRR